MKYKYRAPKQIQNGCSESIPVRYAIPHHCIKMRWILVETDTLFRPPYTDRDSAPEKKPSFLKIIFRANRARERLLYHRRFRVSELIVKSVGSRINSRTVREQA